MKTVAGFVLSQHLQDGYCIVAVKRRRNPPKTKTKDWPFALKMLTLLAQVGFTNAAGFVLVAAETVETVIQTSRLSSQQPKAALKLGRESDRLKLETSSRRLR